MLAAWGPNRLLALREGPGMVTLGAQVNYWLGSHLYWLTSDSRCQ
jgi:hypothetical protein